MIRKFHAMSSNPSRTHDARGSTRNRFVRNCRWSGRIAALSLLLSGSAVLAASPQIKLHSEVLLERTVVKEGITRTELVEPSVVVPGDPLRFVTEFTNATEQPVSQFVVTNPVPGAVTIDPTVLSSLTVSVDAGKSWGKLASLAVPDGQGGMRPALAGDITHVRWVIPRIEAGASGKVSYRAIVR